MIKNNYEELYKKGSTKEKGDNYEELACKYLEEEKYKIIQRNFRSKTGEIDIICKKNNILIFVEVKGGSTFSPPYLRVTPNKIKKITLTAQYYLRYYNKEEYEGIRLDVISIVYPSLEIKHFEDITSRI